MVLVPYHDSSSFSFSKKKKPQPCGFSSLLVIGLSVAASFIPVLGLEAIAEDVESGVSATEAPVEQDYQHLIQAFMNKKRQDPKTNIFKKMLRRGKEETLAENTLYGSTISLLPCQEETSSVSVENKQIPTDLLSPLPSSRPPSPDMDSSGNSFPSMRTKRTPTDPLPTLPSSPPRSPPLPRPPSPSHDMDSNGSSFPSIRKKRTPTDPLPLLPSPPRSSPRSPPRSSPRSPPRSSPRSPSPSPDMDSNGSSFPSTRKKRTPTDPLPPPPSPDMDSNGSSFPSTLKDSVFRAKLSEKLQAEFPAAQTKTAN